MIAAAKTKKPSKAKKQNGSQLPFSKKVDALKTQANASHKQVTDSLDDALGYANQAGIALRKIKAIVKHTNWQAWLDHNFKGSRETARVYMRIAKNWKELEPQRPMTIAQALETLRHRPPKEIGWMIQGYSDWCRKRVHKMMAEKLDNTDIMFLGLFADYFSEFEVEIFEKIKEENRPIAKVVVNLAVQRHKEIQALAKKGQPREIADNAFIKKVKAAFKDRTDLTPRQKQKVELIINGSVDPENSFGEYFAFADKEKTKGKRFSHEGKPAVTYFTHNNQ